MAVIGPINAKKVIKACDMAVLKGVCYNISTLYNIEKATIIDVKRRAMLADAYGYDICLEETEIGLISEFLEKDQ